MKPLSGVNVSIEQITTGLGLFSFTGALTSCNVRRLFVDCDVDPFVSAPLRWTSAPLCYSRFYKF